MSIRITQEDPHHRIVQLLVDELSRELIALYNDEDDDGTAGFQVDDVAVPRAAFVVAWEGDEAVGCGALRPMAEANVVEVKRMFVRPEARGRKISRQILTHLEQLAVDFGYRMVRLETGSLQTEAMSLYENSGYQRITCYEPYEASPQSVCYEKLL